MITSTQPLRETNHTYLLEDRQEKSKSTSLKFKQALVVSARYTVCTAFAFHLYNQIIARKVETNFVKMCFVTTFATLRLTSVNFYFIFF